MLTGGGRGDADEPGPRRPVRGVAVVAVALLVVLAGCSSVGVGGSGERTPYDVPSRTPSVGGVGPPGVAGDAVESPFLLVQSHVGVLTLEPFRVVRERTVRAANGTLLRSVRVDARVSTDRQQYLIEVDRRGPAVDGPRRQVTYAAVRSDVRDGVRQERVLQVTLAPDGTVASAVRVEPSFGEVVYPEDVLPTDPNYRDRLYRYLTVVDNASVRPLRPGVGPDPNATSGTRYRIAARTVTNTRLLSPDANARVSNVSVVTVADERGLVVETVAEYTVRRNGHVRYVTERIAYPSVGNVSIPRPDWYGSVVDSVTRTATTDELGRDGNASRVVDPGDDGRRGRAPTDPDSRLSATLAAGPDSTPPAVGRAVAGRTQDGPSSPPAAAVVTAVRSAATFSAASWTRTRSAPRSTASAVAATVGWRRSPSS